MDQSARNGADFLQLHPATAPRRGLADWLVDAVRRAVADGTLVAGARLPATRELAADLQVSRGVVVEAYQRLREEGLVATRTRTGTVVLDAAPRPAKRARPAAPRRDRLPQPQGVPGVDIDLSPGVPDLSFFPRTAWLRHERAALDHASPGDLGYGDPRGSSVLRRELAGWLARTRGLRIEADEVVVVGGVAQALALLARVLHRRGLRCVAVEDPGSRGARQELEYWGMRTVAVPVDADGVRVDELAASDAGAAVLTPAHQFPTGVLLSPERRRELLDWAAAGRLVIEDDYDAEHRYDRAPVAALHPSAPHLVAHAGSTSKTLAPGMRLGWLVPPPHLLADVIEAKHNSDLGTPALPQLVLARMIAGGDYDRHLRAARARQRRRRDALVGALRDTLPRAQVSGLAAGLHVLVLLPGLTDADTQLVEHLDVAGVRAHPLSWHRVAPGPPGLVLGYAAHPPDRLREAVRRLAAALPGFS